MLKLSEVIVAQYLKKEMIGKHRCCDFDISRPKAAPRHDYIFNTMRENHLIKPGDTIALGSPIFTPYIEIPTLNDYS